MQTIIKDTIAKYQAIWFEEKEISSIKELLEKAMNEAVEKIGQELTDTKSDLKAEWENIENLVERNKELVVKLAMKRYEIRSLEIKAEAVIDAYDKDKPFSGAIIEELRGEIKNRKSVEK